MDMTDGCPSAVAIERPKSVRSEQPVRLKHFERVLKTILPSICPRYSRFQQQQDPFNDNKIHHHHHDTSQAALDRGSPWSSSSLLERWEELPASARVQGSLPGQLQDAARAARKQGQLRSILQCIQIFLWNRSIQNTTTTIVDFGGGSGHLGIPLALLLPNCRIVVVDLRKHSLDLLHVKVDAVMKEIQQSGECNLYQTCEDMPCSFSADNRFQRAKESGPLSNLYSFHGPVEQFTEGFDMALALHLCGEATDVTLRLAAKVQAPFIIVAPCCVGKLSKKALNPDVYNATGDNSPTISYPQSELFCNLITDTDDWDAMVKAADYSDVEESRTIRNATRRTAKALLETDRRLYLEQVHQYKTALIRMEPWEVTPKNDIILAWNHTTFGDLLLEPDLECERDIQYAFEHLGLDCVENAIANCGGTVNNHDRVDWTWEEEQEVRRTIDRFLVESCETKNDSNTLVFPIRMGKRRRKLVHYVAEQMDLAHWCVGKKYWEKTVAVAPKSNK